MSTFREELIKLTGEKVLIYVVGEYVEVTILSVHHDWVQVEVEFDKRIEKLQMSHIVSFITTK